MTVRPQDFWYAVHNTEVLLAPTRRLETFGATVIDYHLVTELMDSVDKVRIRSGRLQAARPEIMTPNPDDLQLEGFQQPAAGQYLEWLRRHAKEALLLRYGFTLRHERAHEELVTDRLDAVLDRVRAGLARQDNPLAALVRGVDEPWEVCLVRLMVEMVQRSAPGNAKEWMADPGGVKHEIEQAFQRAARDRSQLGALADLLKKRELFAAYEDRFFALVRLSG